MYIGRVFVSSTFTTRSINFNFNNKKREKESKCKGCE